MSRRRGGLGVACLLGVLCLPSALAAPPARRVAAPASRPDRALYEEARAALAALKASPRLAARRAEWEKVVLRFRRVVARYPQSGYCDNALLGAGDVYREMAERFKSPRYLDDAVSAYQTLVSEYPSSSLGEPALHSVFEIARASGDRKRIAEAGRAYLDAFPDAKRAPEVKAALKQSAPAQAAALPSPPPPGLARVYNLRFWSGDASTRIVLDVEREVPIHHDRISNPDRLWIDLVGTRLHPNLKDRTFPVGDGLLEQVRVGQNKDDVVRVVLDFQDVKDYSVVYMQDPTRLVIDVRGTPRPAVASAEKPASKSSATPAPTPEPEPESPRAVAEATPPPATPLRPPLTPVPVATPTPPTRPIGAPAASPTPPPTPAPTPSPTPSPTPAPASPATAGALAPPVEFRPVKIPPRRVAALTAPEPRPTPPTRLTPSSVTIDAPVVPERRAAASPSPAPSPSPSPASPTRSAKAEPPASPAPPQPPQTNRAGNYSLARQLGLGARKIVIDAGHGGHDPGTIGHAGLQEKDLVLDVALRLEKLVEQELGADVVMTRSTDVFIPLEERTAIANSKGADLFLSIHANSSRNPTARGIETYFLNFALDPHAEEVAARENAISAATLKDLQGLVKAITLNSKIDESHDFAASVQEALIGNLKPHYSGALDRGVHTAPFYVLIGANMPSVLAEIAFVSHPEEEKLLKTPDYRDLIARSLFEGVKSYLLGLNHAQARQLTATSRASTVGGRETRR